MNKKFNLGPVFFDKVEQKKHFYSKQKYHLEERNSELQEEIFSSQEEHFDNKEKSNSWRGVILYFFFLIIFLGLLARSGQLQIVQGKKNLILSEGNRIRVWRIKSPRGLIYDKNKIVLARNAPGLQVVITPTDIPQEKRNEVYAKLSEILKISISEIEEIIKNRKEDPFEDITLQNNISHEVQLQILAESKYLPGIRIESDIIREYLAGPDFSSVIGYTGEITKEELSSLEYVSYFTGDWIGKVGIEKYYQNELRGKEGRKLVEIDALGDQARVLAEEDSKIGYSLILTIDSQVQKKVIEYLKEGIAEYQARGGAVIIQDSNTGEIISLVSYPSFDNNLFAQGISSEDYREIQDNPQNLLFNRAISGVYPSGSTVKPIVAFGALEEELITKSTIVNDDGPIQIGPYIFRDWVQSWGLPPHGRINVIQAISQSCDIFFYAIGGGYREQRGLGIDGLIKYFTLLGLGQKTGIDLPGEEMGLVPSSSWKEKAKGEPWYLGDTYFVSIGQSYLLATPIQITNATNVFANGGRLLKPQLVSKIIDSDKEVFVFPPQVIKNSVGNSENLKIVKEGMRESVSTGIIWPLKNTKVPVAAKTGTAEFGEKDEKGNYETHAWVTGFAPYDSSEITFTVLLEAGGSGNNAAQVAKKIVDYYFESVKTTP